MTKLSNKNVVRNYEFRVTWDRNRPTADTCQIQGVSQKFLLTNKGTGTLRFLLNQDTMRITGSQMLIAQTWYDNLSEKDVMKFKSDFTFSTFKRVFKGDDHVGVLISMHLRLDQPHIEDLTFQEVAMIFQ